MAPPSLTRRNANEGNLEMHSEFAGHIDVEIPLTSADLSRPPTFPILVCTTCANAEQFDFLTDTSVTVHFPDPAQLNANGGLKKLLQDVTATYHDEWESKGRKFAFGNVERKEMTRASLNFITGVSKARHEQERKKDFENDSWWRRCAQTEIGIMVRHMVWWGLEASKGM